ncbi:MAG: DUF5813 family protein [Natrialbaceae archaeon]|nr:DUF5813 family protein [Natrialbaceae archaeon]
MSNLPESVEQALLESAAFSRTTDGWRLPTTALDTQVTAEAGSEPSFTVKVTIPSLDASVMGEVAPGRRDGLA